MATAERYLGAIVGLITVPIMSRLLTPGEVGVWVVALGIATLMSSARDFGGYSFLIQKSDLTKHDVRSSITIVAIVTVGIVIILSAIAPWLAAVYQSEGVTTCLRVIAVAFLIEIISIPLVTLLRRDLAFGKVAIINTVGAVANAGGALALAVSGFGYMSYAWGWLLGSAISSALALYLRPELWIFRPSLREWRGPLTFGGYYGINSTLYKAYESLSYPLIGRVLSLDAAAVFQRATTMVQLPDRFLFGGVATLALPGFSANARQGGSARVAYLRAVEYVTGVLWPSLTVLAILAYPVVKILLGDQWLETVPIIRILAIASLFAFTAHLDYALLIALGAMKDNTKRALIVVPTAVVVLMGASMFGLVAVALSQIAVKILETVVSLYFVRRNVPIRWRELGGALWRSAGVCIVSAAGAAAAVIVETRLDLSIGGALLGAILAAAGWLIGLWLFKHPLLEEVRQAAKSLLGMRSGGRSEAMIRVREERSGDPK